MDATLFQTEKSAKILVLSEQDSLFETDESKMFGKLLKNDITFVCKITYSTESELLAAIKPDVIIDLDKKIPAISMDLSSGRAIPRIQNIDADMLKLYHNYFLLINQIKQIRGQLNFE